MFLYIQYIYVFWTYLAYMSCTLSVFTLIPQLEVCNCTYPSSERVCMCGTEVNVRVLILCGARGQRSHWRDHDSISNLMLLLENVLFNQPYSVPWYKSVKECKMKGGKWERTNIWKMESIFIIYSECFSLSSYSDKQPVWLCCPKKLFPVQYGYTYSLDTASRHLYQEKSLHKRSDLLEFYHFH